MTGTVASNDSDVDTGAVLTYATTATVQGLTFNSDGSYSFDPANSAYDHLAQGVTQVIVVPYTVTDEFGASATANLAITLTGVNDAPGATQDVVVNYTVTDEQGASATNTLTITVTGVNDAPTATNDAFVVVENAVYSSTLPAYNDVDDGAVVLYSVASLPTHGVVSVNTDGTYSYTPTAGYDGSDSFTYTVTDEFGASNTYTVDVTVDALPKVAITADKLTLVAGETSTVTFTFSEVVTDFTLTDVVVAGGTLSNFTGGGTVWSATFTPAAGGTSALISVDSNTFSDVNGNFNQDGGDANNKLTITFDTILPTIEVLSNTTTLIAGETATITFVLSEDSTDFTLADVLPVGGTLSNFTGSGSIYTATFTPDANFEGNATVFVDSNRFTDAAGNLNADGADANNTVTIAVDTLPPKATIAVDNITADNILNAVESQGMVSVTGTVTGDAKAGDTVTLVVNGNTYTGTVATGLTYAISVAGTDLAADTTIDASVAITDTAGNTGTATTTHTHMLDTTVPVPVITLDPITADNIINATEAGLSNIPVMGVVSGDYKVGDTVTVMVGANIYTTSVLSGGIFAVNVPTVDLTNNPTSQVIASVVTTDVAGNTASASDTQAYTIDLTGPTPTISIDMNSVGGDDVLNATEVAQTQTITGTTTGTTAGDIVTLTVNGVNYTGAVAADLSFSIAVPGSALAADSDFVIDGKVTATDTAGNTGTGTTSHSYTVDTVPPVPTITLDPIALDDVLNLAESQGSVSISGSVGGDAKIGDTVVVNVNGVDYTTTVGAGMLFSVSVLGSALVANGSLQVGASVTSSDAAGNTATASDVRPYTIDLVGPTPQIVITDIATDNIVNAAEAAGNVTINGTTSGTKAGDIVTITLNGKDYLYTLTADNGAFSVTVSGADAVADADLIIDGKVVSTDINGNTGQGTGTLAYTVDTIAPAPTITLNDITLDNVINSAEAAGNVSITGTVTGVSVGDAVTVSVNGVNYTGVVVAGNTFSISVPGSELVAAYNSGSPVVGASVNATDAAGNTASATDTQTYSVDVTPPVPTLTIDVITADNTVNTTEGASTSLTITGTAGGDAKVGDTVTLVLGGNTYYATVAADMSFTVTNVQGSDLLADTDTTVSGSITTTDAAGNTGTAAAQRLYAIDTTPPALTIALDPIATDDNVNLTESSGSVLITGKVTGEFAAGDTVTVQLNDGTTVTNVTTTVDVGGNFAVSVDGSKLVSDADLKVVATVTATDNHGNIGSASTDRAYTVDTVVPTITYLDIVSNPTHGTDNATYYVAGETVQVEVAFDDVVYVNGTPTIQLDIGNAMDNNTGNVVTAYYASGSGSNKLIFEYTVVAGDMDLDNIQIVDNSLTNTTTSTIQDVNGNNAVLAHDNSMELPEGKQEIDAIAPTATLSWTSDGDLLDYATHSVGTPDETAAENAYETTRGEEIGIYKIGDTMYLTVQFNEGVNISNPTNMTLDLQLTPNGGYPANLFPEIRTAVYDAAHSDLAAGKVVFMYTVVAGDEDSPTANGVDMKGIGVGANAIHLNGAVIADVAGNAYAGSLNSLTEDRYEYVDGVAPTATAAIKSWQDSTGFYQGQTQTTDYGTGTDINAYDPITGAYISTASGNIEGDVTTDETDWKLNIYPVGILDVGDALNIYDADTGTLLGSVTSTTTLSNGDVVYVFDDPRFSATSKPTDNTAYRYYTKVMDMAGNEAAASQTFTITYDATKPDNYAHITVAVDDYTFSVDQTTQDFLYTGDVTDGQSTNDQTLTITGTLDHALTEGHRLFIYRGSNQTDTSSFVDPTNESAIPTGATVATTNGIIGEVTSFTTDPVTGAVTWSFVDQTTLTVDSTYNYYVKIMDDAGNLSDFSSNGAAGTNGGLDTSTGLDVTIDMTPPGAPSLTSMTTDTVAATTTGTSGTSTIDTATNGDLNTRDNTLVFSGSIGSALGTGESLQISVDGGTTWNNPTTLVGTTWTYDYSGTVLASGMYTLYMRTIDAAGNAMYTRTNYTVDTVAPSPTLTQPVAPAVTTSTSFTFTSAQSGAAESSATVALIEDINHNGIYDEGIDKVLSTTAAATDGSWSLTSPTLAAGVHDLALMEWDAAGNRTRLTQVTAVDVVTGTAVASATTWGTTGGNTSYGMASNLNSSGLWSFMTDRATHVTTDGVTYTTTSLTLATGIANDISSVAMLDLNRDGVADMVSTDPNAITATDFQVWTSNGTGGYNSSSLAAPPWNGIGDLPYWRGGSIAIDINGDGSADVVFGETDVSSPLAVYVNNGSGVLSTSYRLDSATIGNNLYNLLANGEVSAVDLANNGFVDIAMHAWVSQSSFNTYQLVLLNNSGGTSSAASNWTVTQQIDNIFRTNYTGSSEKYAMTWADFNNDGFMDLYLSAGRNAGTMEYTGRIYYNNGAGLLATTGTYVESSGVAGLYSQAVDWNMDGAIDIVKFTTAGGVNLYTNGGNGSTWTTTSLAALGANPVGTVAVDYDWDGDLDLLVSYGGNTATQLITNNNGAAAGTELHVRILDGNGVGAYFGNTVQLFDASGSLVASQIINPQSGIGTNDDSSLVNFYGLSADTTYTVVMKSNANGTATSDTWSVTTADNTDATVLTTAHTVGTSLNLVGTGYNDTLVANGLSGTINGGGGWSEVVTRSDTATWSATGGMDTVDLSNATAALTVNLNTGSATGYGTLTLQNIEAAIGGSGNDTFTDSSANNIFDGRGGNDTYVLSNGGHDIIDYNWVTAGAADGGNGSDIINNFTLGDITTNANADVIDLTHLLSGYTGTAHVYWDVTDAKYNVDAASIDQGLNKYVNVVVNGANTEIQVDANGTGSFSTIATLQGVNTTLADLIANHQVWIA
ncbi:MAG: type 1 secretion target domain-containng protein [Burkholderiaceae bacterium]|nr:type 1 secretion target domain-containng protein [Burkholderiaceae bacterium]